MKSFAKALFAFYLVFLLWVVLFKLSFDISAVLGHGARSLSLVPFVNSSRGELVENIFIFIPFGLLLGIIFKQVGFWRKLACAFAFSLAVEIIQYVLAIGITDITDLATNTLGGLIGLALYSLGSKHIDTKNWDRFIAVTTAILLVAFMLVRVFMLRIRY